MGGNWSKSRVVKMVPNHFRGRLTEALKQQQHHIRSRQRPLSSTPQTPFLPEF